MAGALRRRALLAGAGAWPLVAAAQAVMPLPVLPPVVALRPLSVHNPRFAMPAAGWVESILGHARDLAWAHLGVRIRWEPLHDMDIAAAFAPVTGEVQATIAPGIYDFKRGRGDTARLIEGTRRSLAAGGNSVASMLAYARPHLSVPLAADDLPSLADALVRTQLARLNAWRDLKAADGAALLDDRPYNEYAAWLVAAATAGWPCEVVITNQLIASAEYADNHLHSALRGGVSNGLTTQSRGSRQGLVSVLSLYPFAGNDAATTQLRGGDAGGTPQAAVWAAALLVHELGHQLLHLNHPFARPACIMNPPPLLRFREWVAGLDAQACPVGSSAEMRPGAVRFRAL